MEREREKEIVLKMMAEKTLDKISLTMQQKKEGTREKINMVMVGSLVGYKDAELEE